MLQTLMPLRVKVGSISYNVATVSSSIGYTGVGFKPKAIIFWGGINATNAAIIGGTDGTGKGRMNSRDAAAADTWADNTDFAIALIVGASDSITGAVTFDADGFTVAWTKIGSPTGTATINYLAIA